jgi:hypothetical protein
VGFVKPFMAASAIFFTSECESYTLNRKLCEILPQHDFSCELNEVKDFNIT